MPYLIEVVETLAAFLIFFCGIYIVLIGPILFRLWIIPRIENRYRTQLKIKNPYFKTPGAWWLNPPVEISYYICCKKYRLTRCINRYHKGPLLMFKEINYDIKTASRAEIALSQLTMAVIFFLIVCGIFMWVLDYFNLKTR